MMPDYPLGETLDFKFTTRAFATGIPTTLAGTPVVEIYEDNSLTQITAAETLTVDFDAVTGLNNLRIVATSGNGFEAGKSYAAVISTGTVGGVSVVGEVVAQFSIERSPVNWANVTAPTTAVDLSGTDIQLADTTTTLTNLPAITADWLTAAGTAADFTTEIQAGLATAAALATVDTVVDAILVDTDTTIPGLITALNDLSAAQVNAEVVDALATDTYAEPTGVPAATTALATKIGYLYMALRNQIDMTATKKTFYDDAGAAEWEKDLSDDGTTYSESEGNAI